MAERVGQQLGNYTLIRRLGEGGFAEVYLGEHIHLGTQAAIKILHTQLSNDSVNDFRNEARTIARLVHPGIVRVLEFGIEDKTPFLVMDYASNGTLRQRHSKGTILPLPTVVTYAKQVADALQYAHDEKLIHRDVKPENMLVGRRGEILLSDFGIALVAQSSRYQSTQEMAGTMAYMPPEQISGKPRPASDQYALGIVDLSVCPGTTKFSQSDLLGSWATTRVAPTCHTGSDQHVGATLVVALLNLTKFYTQPLCSIPHIIKRIPSCCQPCSQQTHQSTDQTPEEQEDQDDEQATGRTANIAYPCRRVLVAGIVGDVVSDEAGEVGDGTGDEAFQEATPALDGNFAGDKTGDEVDQERDEESEHGVAQGGESQSLFDGWLRGRVVGLIRRSIEKSNSNALQSTEDTCSSSDNQGLLRASWW